jgi:uncharacterized protein (DUF1800 family)
MVAMEERRRIARLVHRFGFGPRPGEFASLLSRSFESAANEYLISPPSDLFADSQPRPNISDLGPRPKANSSAVVPYVTEKRAQLTSLTFWWLDRMVLSEHSLKERLTWFWHGHWATSYQKVDDALPMYLQNQTLRKYALGDFRMMSREMVNDAALIFWLDGQTNTIKAPNENLSRELMELFILGVNRYSENDVRETAKALTGYKVIKNSGKVTFNSKKHFSGFISVLGEVGKFDGNSLSDFLVSRSDCATFISERLWYRFISSSAPMNDSNLANSFVNRDIQELVLALGKSEALKNPAHSLVKSPLEWFISTCRALSVIPSQISNKVLVRRFLDNLGQVPFFPPSVGGWPADQAWLSSSSAQYRIQFATALIKEANLKPISSLKTTQRIQGLADWLGVAMWSDRTKIAFQGAIKDPERLTLLALCSPEYVVSA